ncbi:glycosyltransferase family 4 protein [Lacinutrix jangbogonensis]|uniref:glycosyltransferase family 4 protein n=1 Tax=Lacinutrix jangbogonensis TaxID=1469557 RepID=UPI00053E50F1|nr:glycosyltransferase family 4 protein [Lacinutrix jangbogonensis]
MKVFLISNMYPSIETPYYGVFVENSEKKLTKLGVEFTAKSLIKGLERNTIKKAIKYLKYLVSICFNLIRSSGFEIIYLHYNAIAVKVLIIFLRFNKNKKIIINFHGGDVIDVKGQLRKTPNKILLLSDLIIVPSEFFKNILTENFKVNASKIFVSASGGIDVNNFKPFEVEEKEELLTLGFFSRVTQGKGWQVFLDALNGLKERKIRFRAIMIGGGTDHNLLKEKLKFLDIEDSVEVVGAISHTKLPFYLNQLHINVFPTLLHESLGLVGLEAMACGCPVIGSNIGGLKTYISHGVNGYLFETNNSLDLVNKILLYIDLSEVKKQKMSYEAIKTAKQFCSEKTALDLFNQIKTLKN